MINVKKLTLHIFFQGFYGFLINDLVFLIYEQPLQMRVGAPYSPARPAQLE